MFSRRLGLAAQAGPGPTVAIVGAGFSGTMAAVHLRRALGPGATICLFDRTGRFARGPAYAASSAPHLLNVRARNMSAFPDEPDHFDRWVEDHVARTPADAGELARTAAGNFATRRLYGRYLRQLLYREMAEGGGRVLLAGGEVTGLEPAGPAWRLLQAGGRHIMADVVVLATGNVAPRTQADELVFDDPWSDAATQGLRPDEHVLVVGTGLTMVDLALGMRARGFAGPIIALSRRGLTPHRHQPAHAAWPAMAAVTAERTSITALLRRLRGEAARAEAAGVDWRAVIDGLRPATVALCRGLPAAEQRRFLRHLRPFWDVHRHRMAPPVADAFDALCDTGGLRVMRGRVTALERQAGRARVTVACRGGAEVVLQVQRVIYATGPRCADMDALIGGLFGSGLAQIDDQGLGVKVDDGLRLVTDCPSPPVWALGPVVRGAFWESTAVPDIRVQAKRIADAIAATVFTPPSAL